MGGAPGGLCDEKWHSYFRICTIVSFDQTTDVRTRLRSTNRGNIVGCTRSCKTRLTLPRSTVGGHFTDNISRR